MGIKEILLDNNFTIHEAIIIEWQYGYAGGFQTQLIQLIAKADVNNKIKLHKGFPDEVDAFTLFAETRVWWTKVEEKFIKFKKEQE